MKLSKREVYHIEEWLNEEHKEHKCPFGEFFCWKDSKTCKAIFPTLKKRLPSDVVYHCPCTQYSLGFVVERAKEVVKQAMEAFNEH